MATEENSSVDEGSILIDPMYTRSDHSASLNRGSDLGPSLYMGSDLGASLYEGSDLVYKKRCPVCEENGDNNEALFYCQECNNCYCHKCVEHHNQLYTRHTILGRESLAHWAIVEQCKYHKDAKLTMFCEDHDQLICSVCHLNSHQDCNKIVLIADKVKNMRELGELWKMTEKIQALLLNLTQTKQNLKDHVEWMRKVKEEILCQINTLRTTLNKTLDSMERKTVEELDTLFAAFNKSLQDDIQNAQVSHLKMQSMKVEIQNIEKNTETMTLMLYRICKEKTFQIESAMSTIVDRNLPCIAFYTPPSIQHMLTLPTLGTFINPNNQIKLNGKTLHRLRFKNDKEKCCVSGIHETASGEILLTDRRNLNMKLLHNTFNVVAVLALPCVPWSMCSIDSSLVAVAVHANEVHFIRATNGQLVQERKLKLKHMCLGVAHQPGTLYVTSGTALYRYTLDGTLVNMMYEDYSGQRTVTSCAASPDGARIYVTNEQKRELITLSRDGTVISTLSDPSFQWGYLPALHVTHSGQLLVCGDCTNILQVDRDGKYIVKVVVEGHDDMKLPLSVHCSSLTGSLIIGMLKTNSILEFKTLPQ